jgi:hypothetical protein
MMSDPARLNRIADAILQVGIEAALLCFAAGFIMWLLGL